MEKEYSYHFKDLKIPYGKESISVNGTAKFQIEDLSSGERGDQEELIAFFYKAVIRSYDTDYYNPNQGLTEKDLLALEDVVLEALNDDYELCSNLPSFPNQ